MDTFKPGVYEEAQSAVATVPHAEATPSACLAQGGATAVAHLYGEPLFDLPKDLYIPPDALQLILEAFEGPLDLLLYLIRQQNFNILDIPMVTLTQQYMCYVEELRNQNLELAAEYLLMAAMLIEIKSRMLLPKPQLQSDEPEEDPRAELVRRLLEYEKMKLAALQLQQWPQAGRDFFQAQATLATPVPKILPTVNPADLQAAWQALLRRAQWVQHHQINQEKLSVREFMSALLRKLQGQAFVAFDALLEPRQGVAACVVTFIALLELARENLVLITQGAAYAPIYVRLGGNTLSDTTTGVFQSEN